MSIFGRSENPSILIVADAALPPFCDAVAALSEAGAAFAVAPDVYTAMAQLTGSPDIRHVLIDVRQLNQHERAFLQLAPRYFRNALLSIADLPGAAARVRLDDNPTPMKSVSAFVASVSAAEAVASFIPVDDKTPVDPSQAEFSENREFPRSEPQIPAPPAPHSADADPLSTDEPSLHEAVRRRMAGDDAGTFQRKAPVRTPPRAAPTVSPQELDALLAPHDAVNPESHPGDANRGRPR